MQRTPPLDATIEHFGVWRTGIGIAVGLGAATLITWLLTFPSPLPVAGVAGLTAGAAALAGAIWLAGSTRPMRLQWDGQTWRAGASALDPADAPPAELTVAADLGGWMLLRLAIEATADRRRTVWLPAQRRGHEAHWHALRCAVYSPRPAPGGPSEAEPEPPE